MTSSGDVITLENPVTAVARRLGLNGTRSATKFVPDLYLYNSARVRLAVLQGLLDTDGGPVTQRNRTCRIQYTTTSPRLRDDVIFLVRSLGGVAYQHRHDAARSSTSGSRKVSSRSGLPGSASEYQAAGGGRRPMRFIESIEPAGTAEAVCISVAAADSLYTTEDFLLTHNTLNDSFIILDEAQNTSAEQMKMFLTRLGFGSQVVVTGDVTQVDLPAGQVSGLRVVQGILDGIEDIHFARLTSHDVVRHRLVGKIVDAYERYDAQERQTQQLDRRVKGSKGPGLPGGRAARAPMSIDIANEAGIDVDEVGLAAVARFTLDQMRIHPLAELSVLLVDERTMTELHERWMGEPGPTDVLAFPMDELRPPHLGGNRDDQGPEPGLIGDVVLCPQVAAEQAEKAGHSTQDELELLCVHGILHLLGYDHAEPEEHAVMFGTQDQLLKAWREARDTKERPGL